MHKEDKQMLADEYRSLGILELWKRKLIIDKHIDFYFSLNYSDAFFDFLEESLVISSIIKEKPFFERENLLIGLKIVEEYERINEKKETARNFSEQVAYLQKLAY